MLKVSDFLSSEDAEDLLAGDLTSLADPAALRDFVYRVAASLRELEGTRRQLQSDITRIASDRAMTTSPLATAIEALCELDEISQRQVFDTWGNATVAALNNEYARVRHSLIAAQALRAQVTKILKDTLANNDINEQTKADITAVLNNINAPEPFSDAAWDSEHTPGTGFVIPPKELPDNNDIAHTQHTPNPVVGNYEPQNAGSTLEELFTDSEPAKDEYRAGIIPPPAGQKHASFDQDTETDNQSPTPPANSNETKPETKTQQDSTSPGAATHNDKAPVNTLDSLLSDLPPNNPQPQQAFQTPDNEQEADTATHQQETNQGADQSQETQDKQRAEPTPPSRQTPRTQTTNKSVRLDDLF